MGVALTVFKVLFLALMTVGILAAVAVLAYRVIRVAVDKARDAREYERHLRHMGKL